MYPGNLPWPSDVMALGDQIAALTVGEARELSEYLRVAHGIESPGGRPTILNCGAAPVERPAVRFSFRCPRTWDSLRREADSSVRFCDGCSQSVHYCDTPQDAVRHTLLGHCIAVPARLAGPLVEAHDHPITMGVPSPDRLDGDRYDGDRLDEPVTVRLDGFDPRKKVSVIKALREITGLALLEARDMVEGAPSPVKEGIDRVEAEAIRKQLVDAGGTISLV
jgi:hypothetical protein